MTPLEKQIQKKIEEVGTPLCDPSWGVQIYRGILTGYNPAFLINTETKDRLIQEGPRSAEIIRPILRGKDIKRYSYERSDKWLIVIPSGYTNQHKGQSDAEYFIKSQYPAVYRHFLQVHQEYLNDTKKQTKSKGLIRRDDMGDYWWELRSCAYMEDFSKPKIIWGEISDRAKFMIDESGKYFTEATTFILTGPIHLQYLLAVLNSKVSEYAFGKIGTTTGMGTVRWKKYKILDLRVPQISESQQMQFVSIVDDIIKNKQNGQDTSLLERNIDVMLYEIFGFEPMEIKYIEGVKNDELGHIG